MARAPRKSNGCRRGTFKRKRMGKGYSTVRKERIGTRPVLKITPTEDDTEAEKQQKAEALKAAAAAVQE
ncbi:MAG: hypothetical protein KDE27_12315 [Planctomycetes bacterium]|nr:hypothetical protein [Planctomycetota bacterium]